MPSRATPDTLHGADWSDRKSTRLNSSHLVISYAVFCLKKKHYEHRFPNPSFARLPDSVPAPCPVETAAHLPLRERCLDATARTNCDLLSHRDPLLPANL